MIRFLLPAFFSICLSAAILAPPSLAQTEPELTRMSERAFEGAQWVMATQAARAVAQVGARAAVGTGPLGKKIRQRQRLESNLILARKGLADTAGVSADQSRIWRNDMTRLSRALDLLDQDIRERFPLYTELANPQPLGYADLRKHLHQGEALILFLSGRETTYVWVITQKRSAWHRSDMSAAELSNLVRTLRVDLDPTGPARSAASLGQTSREASFDQATAHQLYQRLLAPVMDVLKDTAHVFVVKDGALASLPLSVLITEPQATDLQSAAWLARRFAFTTLPAVSSLASIRANPRTGNSGEVASFVGFGDPIFSGLSDSLETAPASRSINAFFSGTGTKLEAIRALSPLPGTARELHRIAEIFPEGQSLIHVGLNATEAAVKTMDLSQTSILSFATHGLVTGDISGLAEPALALTPPDQANQLDDGLLTASEASMLDLNADWVILSACNTAAGDGTPGAEGLSGLTRAFLFAGAQSLLVSHWPVRDDVAALLTSNTLRRLQQTPDLGRSEALRLAIIDIITDETDPTLAHPSAWAPFVVVGEGGVLSR